jgi:ABC-2 type transport system permease protein
MTALATIRLIAGRELRERVVKKGYVIGTLVTVAVVVAAVIVPSLLSSDGPEELRVVVVGSVPDGFEEQVDAALPPDTELLLSELEDRPAGISALEEDEVDAVLVDREELVTDGPPNVALRAALEGALRLDEITRNLEAAGLEAGDVAAALTVTTMLDSTDIGGQDTSGGFAIASLLTILLLIGVQLSGATLLAGAMEEKSGRVVEMLVSTARPWQLLTAKVAATSLMSFAQVGLIVASGLLANAYADTVPLPEATASVVAISGVMLIAGFLFYAALFTVAGTMASTLEDAQQTAGPLYLLLFAGYGAVFIAVFPNPSGIIAQVLTYLPPTAPFVVPARVALDAISSTQVAIAILVTLIGAAATLRLAGRIYASSVLAGGKLTWRGALKAEPVR